MSDQTRFKEIRCADCGHRRDEHDIEPPYQCNGGFSGFDSNNIEVDADCGCESFAHIKSKPSTPAESDCKHPTIWPDGTCTDCGVLATLFPGKCESFHKMVPRPPVASPSVSAELVEALEELCHQIRISNAVDDHGHDLKNLRALHQAESALSRYKKGE